MLEKELHELDKYIDFILNEPAEAKRERQRVAFRQVRENAKVLRAKLAPKLAGVKKHD